MKWRAKKDTTTITYLQLLNPSGFVEIRSQLPPKYSHANDRPPIPGVVV